MTEEPLEFQLDCAEDRLERLERLISKLINGLSGLDKQKADTKRLIEALHFEIEKQ